MKNLWRIVQMETVKHAPAILTGIGIAGMVSTAVLTGTATIKAVKIVEEKNLADKGKKEVIKAVWKNYIPALVTAGLSIGCLIGASSLSARRAAALSAVYHISETALTDYKEAAKEVVGIEKEKEIQTKASEKAVERNPVSQQSVIITGNGNNLCYDPAFDRYFYSDIEKIRKAVNDTNARLMREMYVSLNEFYYEIGAKSIPIGDDIGWNVNDGLIEVNFSSTLSDDNRPCIVLEYRVGPKYDF